MISVIIVISLFAIWGLIIYVTRLNNRIHEAQMAINEQQSEFNKRVIEILEDS